MQPAPQPAVYYEIRDTAGTLIAIHERVDAADGKKFFWKQPNGTLGLNGTPVADLPLYGSEHLAEWPRQRPVVLVEGEKVAYRLIEAGFAAVGTVTGASSTPSAHVISSLRGRRIVLWPDADDVGRDHMERVMVHLAPIAPVSRLDWKTAPAGGDAADLLESSGKEAVQELIGAALRGPESVRPFVDGGPICWEEQGVYSIQWPSTLMEFDYVHNDHGDIWAELEVFSSAAGYEGSLVRTRINLIKGNTRRDAAKELDTRTKALGLNWSGMVDEASRFVVDSVREGKPAILLRDAVEPVTSEWLMEPLILGRRPTIWFGDGSAAKSYAALAAAASIQSGRSLLGFEPSVRVPVAYLDWEWDDWEHKKRLIEMGADDLDVLYIDCKGTPLADQTDRIRRLIRPHHSQFLIVDSAAYAVEGEPESADVTMRFFRALDSFGLGSLILAHTTKTGIEDKPFGSQFWYASARLIWFVKKEQEEGSNALKLAFINKKSNTGPKPPPIGLSMLWDSGKVHIQRTDWREMSQVMDKMPLHKRISYAVSREPKSYAELAEELDTTPESVRKTIARFEKNFVHITRAVDRVTIIGLRS
jgi:hypothetical protein